MLASGRNTSFHGHVAFEEGLPLPDNRRGQAGTTGLSLVHDSGRSATGHASKAVPGVVGFDRQELTIILNLYGQKVARSEWRDYAVDFLKDRALFSIYRQHSEQPQFVIEKNPKLRNWQGQYTVTNSEGRVLKRGHELSQVLRVLNPDLAVVR
jgi:hypothetical protein